jgi:hypothetical protein
MSEKPEGEVPWPKTAEELSAYIEEMKRWPESATESGEGYGRCVYAMSYAALAAFRYIAGTLGVTGFQASCADMDFLAQNRGYKHGMIVFDGGDLLYPQYDSREKLEKWIRDTTQSTEFIDKAKSLLADSPNAHPNVRDHWERIAGASA